MGITGGFMDINYFREFVVLSEKGNYMEAADALFISQSALSRHIKTLEEELGIILFDRTTRKISITKIGEAFLPYARKIADIQLDYQKFIYNEIHNQRDNLTLGFIPSITRGPLADTLELFLSENPGIHVNIIEADSLLLLDMLQKKECDMAILRDIEDLGSEFCKIPIYQDNMVAICPIDHPLLAQKESISIQELAKEPLLWLPKGTHLHRICKDAFRQAGLSPDVVFTSHTGENIISHVEHGMGIAMLMREAAQRMSMAYSKVKLMEISPPITSTIVLAYHKGKKLNSASKLLINTILSYKEKETCAYPS